MCDHPDLGLKMVTMRIVIKFGELCNTLFKVRMKYCTECEKYAAYNVTGEKPAYCGEHRKEGMVNVMSRSFCKEKGCNKIRRYGIKSGKAEYCNEHRKQGMINISAKRCITEGCNIHASYGILRAEYCNQHKKEGMNNLQVKLCSQDGCKKQVTYDKDGNRLTVCGAHNMNKIKMPVKIKKGCSSCGLQMKLNKEGKCEYCRPATFKAVRLAKQNALMEYLDARELIGSVTDKVVEGGMCGKERPDRVFDFGDKIVILECDENQRKGRERECEVTRMKNIGQMFGGTPVYFIRWNPDGYTCSEMVAEKVGMRHKRVGDLLLSISEGIITLPNVLVAAHYMYYDGWSNNDDLKWELLTAFEGLGA